MRAAIPTASDGEDLNTDIQITAQRPVKGDVHGMPLRLTRDQEKRLRIYAAHLGKSKADVARQAIIEFLSRVEA